MPRRRPRPAFKVLPDGPRRTSPMPGLGLPQLACQRRGRAALDRRAVGEVAGAEVVPVLHRKGRTTWARL